jgi:hypothetical protein
MAKQTIEHESDMKATQERGPALLPLVADRFWIRTIHFRTTEDMQTLRESRHASQTQMHCRPNRIEFSSRNEKMFSSEIYGQEGLPFPNTIFAWVELQNFQVLQIVKDFPKNESACVSQVVTVLMTLLMTVLITVLRTLSMTVSMTVLMTVLTTVDDCADDCIGDCVEDVLTLLMTVLMTLLMTVLMTVLMILLMSVLMTMLMTGGDDCVDDVLR